MTTLTYNQRVRIVGTRRYGTIVGVLEQPGGEMRLNVRIGKQTTLYSAAQLCAVQAKRPKGYRKETEL